MTGKKEKKGRAGWCPSLPPGRGPPFFCPCAERNAAFCFDWGCPMIRGHKKKEKKKKGRTRRSRLSTFRSRRRSRMPATPFEQGRKGEQQTGDGADEPRLVKEGKITEEGGKGKGEGKGDRPPPPPPPPPPPSLKKKKKKKKRESRRLVHTKQKRVEKREKLLPSFGEGKKKKGNRGTNNKRNKSFARSLIPHRTSAKKREKGRRPCPSTPSALGKPKWQPVYTRGGRGKSCLGPLRLRRSPQGGGRGGGVLLKPPWIKERERGRASTRARREEQTHFPNHRKRGGRRKKKKKKGLT